MKRLLNLGEDVDGIDEDGNTGLHMAAESGAEEIVKFLVSLIQSWNDMGWDFYSWGIGVGAEQLSTAFQPP